MSEELKTYNIRSGGSSFEVQGTCLHREPHGGAEIRNGKDIVAIITYSGAVIVERQKEPHKC